MLYLNLFSKYLYVCRSFQWGKTDFLFSFGFFLRTDSSTEQFTDQSGVDLIQFFKETLNKNPKDRNMLVKIEKDLLGLALDKS